MTRNSMPGGGSPLDELIRRLREAQTEIQEQVLKRSLERWERLALASAERSNAALTSIYKDTERTLSDTASRVTAEADRKLNRLRRRIWHPWLPALLGAAASMKLPGKEVLPKGCREREINRCGLFRSPEGRTTIQSETDRLLPVEIPRYSTAGHAPRRRDRDFPHLPSHFQTVRKRRRKFFPRNFSTSASSQPRRCSASVNWPIVRASPQGQVHGGGGRVSGLNTFSASIRA